MIFNTVSVIAILAAIQPAVAFWRLQCFGVVGIARVDPLVNPNELAAHVHTIKGGNGLSMTSTVDDLLNSKCTSCEVRQDKSAYWSPQVYFKDDNGKYEMVPETAGHVTYYKFVPAFAGGKFKDPVALPNGLKMISGKTTRRRFDYAVPDPPRPWTGKDASQDALEQKAIGFNCLNYKKAPEDSLYRHFLPDKNYLDQNCPDGLRIEVLFPICWNGKDLDSKNHKSHMAYSDAGLNGGNCPPGFDTVVNQLFFETIYDVGAYKNRKGIFTLANGDPLGYGLHADAFIAWEAGVLQAATEQCGPVTPGSPGADGITSKCPVFDIVPEAEQRQCKMELPSAMSKMNFASDLMSLPGNNPLQYGPEDAAVNPGTPLLPTPAPPAPVEAPRPSLGYSSGSSQSTDARGHILLEATGVPAANNNNAAPAPTPAANAPSPAGEKILRTSTYTKDGAVFEVVIVEDVVTVTVDQAGETPAPVKRHAHIHEHLGRRSHVHHPRRR